MRRDGLDINYNVEGVGQRGSGSSGSSSGSPQFIGKGIVNRDNMRRRNDKPKYCRSWQELQILADLGRFDTSVNNRWKSPRNHQKIVPNRQKISPNGGKNRPKIDLRSEAKTHSTYINV